MIKTTVKVNFARIWCITTSTPDRRITPHRNVYMAKFYPSWEGYPVWQTRLPAATYVIRLKWVIKYGQAGYLITYLGSPNPHVNRPLLLCFLYICDICARSNFFFRPVEWKDKMNFMRKWHLIQSLQREMYKEPTLIVFNVFRRTLSLGAPSLSPRFRPEQKSLVTCHTLPSLYEGLNRVVAFTVIG